MLCGIITISFFTRSTVYTNTPEITYLRHDSTVRMSIEVNGRGATTWPMLLIVQICRVTIAGFYHRLMYFQWKVTFFFVFKNWTSTDFTTFLQLVSGPCSHTHIHNTKEQNVISCFYLKHILYPTAGQELLSITKKNWLNVYEWASKSDLASTAINEFIQWFYLNY